MSETERLGEIIRTVRHAYGSLDEPNYAFVEKRYRDLRCHPVVGDLMSRYFIKDETDLNDHVSMHLRILYPEGSVVACLSFVDGWAMLFRLGADNLVYESVIDSGSLRTDSYEHEIVKLLRNHGFKLLTKSEAATPISMNLLDTERSEAMVYHAIVSDDGVVPQVLVQ